MKERIDTIKTPLPIQDLFIYPYKFFSDYLKDEKLDVLDIACGELNNHYGFLWSSFREVIAIDKDKELAKKDKRIKIGDILNIPLFDKLIDVAFCFETIEHLSIRDLEKALNELERVTKKNIVIGSINKDGSDFIKGVEIWKAKNNKNSFHLNELNGYEFRGILNDRFPKQGKEYFSSVLIQNEIQMINGLYPDAYCNYCIINL